MSMGNEDGKLPATPVGQLSMLLMDDDQIIRGVITESIRVSQKSRAEIAEEMQALMKRRVTERMLNAYCDDAKEMHRFPLAFTRAFCHSVGDITLLRLVVEKAGFQLLSPEDIAFAQLGRFRLQQEQIAEKISQLETQLREKR